MKLSCYIVQDLLPAFAERLTGEYTTNDIKEHLQECETCRESFDHMRSEELMVSNPEHNKEHNNEAVDYLKKSHCRVTLKSIFAGIAFGIILLLSLLGFYQSIDFAIEIMVMMPLLILAGYLFMRDYMKREDKPGKDFIVVNAVVVLASLLSIGLMFWINTWTNTCIHDNVFPFGMKAEQVGPFIHNILATFRIFMILGAVYSIWMALRRSDYYYVIISSSIVGISLVATFIHLLKTLDDFTKYESDLYHCILIYLEGIIVTVSLYFYLRRNRRGKQNRKANFDIFP